MGQKKMAYEQSVLTRTVFKLTITSHLKKHGFREKAVMGYVRPESFDLIIQV